MGNYRNVEIDFIQRTLELIAQYESILSRYEFGSQYNYTLLTNCLLGLVVLPKERAFDYLPTDKITKELRGEMGLNETEINTDISDLRRLIWSMRQSIAHFE